MFGVCRGVCVGGGAWVCVGGGGGREIGLMNDDGGVSVEDRSDTGRSECSATPVGGPSQVDDAYRRRHKSGAGSGVIA